MYFPVLVITIIWRTEAVFVVIRTAFHYQKKFRFDQVDDLAGNEFDVFQVAGSDFITVTVADAENINTLVDLAPGENQDPELVFGNIG